MVVAASCRSSHRPGPPATARERRLRRRATAALGLMLWVAGQAGLACHGAPPPETRNAGIDALIAADLCTGGAIGVALTGGPAPDDDTSTPGVGCLHRPGGGCHAASEPLVGGWLTAAPGAAGAPTETTASWGKSGAPAWMAGHPARGPPRAGV